MTVLGIETSTAVCGAALARDGRIIAEAQVEGPQLHSERLLPLVKEVFETAGLTLGEIDGVACSIGPGSFTGLRIGLSVAKGLAYAAGLPIAAVPTLEALAFRAALGGRVRSGAAVLASIDARRDEVYAALYRWNGRALDVVSAPAALAAAAVVGSLAEDVVLAGDGSAKLLRCADELGVARRMLPPAPGDGSGAAGPVALLGELRLLAGARADLESLEPDYVKDFYTTATPISQQG